MKLDEKYILWMLVLHLYGSWLSRFAWPYGETFSYCKCTTYFHGLNFSPQSSNTYTELCANVLFVCE